MIVQRTLKDVVGDWAGGVSQSQTMKGLECYVKKFLFLLFKVRNHLMVLFKGEM